jgi:hypothetical protein
VRVREAVEVPKGCCVGSLRIVDGAPQFDILSLRRHQLFSSDHADNLDPEISQWLPRIVCPACTLKSQCQDGFVTIYFLFLGHYLPFTVARAQRRDAMLRHIESCKGFQTQFPDERGELFSFSSNLTTSLEEGYRVLKMTFGQLQYLSAQLGKKRKSRKRKPSKITVAKVEKILCSWHPIVKPGVEEVWPSDFPPVRIPRYFTAGGSKTELEYDVSAECDGALGPNSSASFSIYRRAIMGNAQDKAELAYPELYLPPHLLPPTTDPAYLAAAVAAHAPSINSAPPLLDEYLLFPQPEAAVAQLNDPVSMGLMPSPAGDANSHPQNFQSTLQDTLAQSVALFSQLFRGP